MVDIPAARIGNWKTAGIYAAILVVGIIAVNKANEYLGDKVTMFNGFNDVVIGLITATVLGVAIGLVKRAYGVMAFVLVAAYVIAKKAVTYVPEV